MANESVNAASREQQVNEIIAAYLQAQDAGQAPDRQRLLRDHAEFAAELESYFADQDSLEPLVNLGGAAQPAAPRSAEALTLVHTGPQLETLSPGAKVPYFGDYELLQEIARGGMGVVYKARQVSLNRIVAIKMILAGQLASPADVQRFRSEAENAARLDHPHIVPIYEVGDHEGQQYFSMKLVEGGSLAQWIADCRLQIADLQKTDQVAVVQLMALMARATHYAHQRGILHRDLKPANILLQRAYKSAICNLQSAMPMITDFGLAKQIRGDQGTSAPGALTQSGAIVGTPSYMAPEQAAGHKSLTTAADIYSLGAILYELLTGRAPFKAATPLETILQVLEKEPQRPRILNPLLDADLETICLKSLQKEPERRYGSAEALAEDLERFLNGVPIAARPVGRTERLWLWCRRNPAVASLTATVAASLVLAVFVLAVSIVRVTTEKNDKEIALREKDQALTAAQASERAAKTQEGLANESAARAETQRRIAAAQEKIAREQERIARRRLYAAQMSLAQQAADRGHSARVLGLLESQRPRFDEEDQRTFEWYHLWRRCQFNCRLTWRLPNTHALHVTFSPDGKTLAAACWDYTVRIKDMATGRVTASRRANTVMCVTFSPDGKTLASAAFGEPAVKLWDVTTDKERKVLSAAQGYVRYLAFSPDGKTLAAGGEDGSIKLWNVPTGRERVTLRRHAAPVVSLAYSPDGKTLASASGWGADGGVVNLWDVAAEPVRSRLRLPAAFCVAFCPDGKTLAAAREAVRLYDVATGLEQTVHKTYSGSINWLAFSPEGKTLALGSDDRTVKLWEPATGRERTYAHDDRITSVAFAPDGQTLASAGRDNTVKLWNVAPAPEPTTLRPKGGVAPCLAFSPDGKRLALGDADSAKLWDVATGQPAASFKGRTAETLAFSHDGKTLAMSSGNIVKVMDVAGRQERASLRGHIANIRSIAFSADDKTLASADHDEKVRVWDLATQQARPGTLEGRSVAFSPDGRTLATGRGMGWVTASFVTLWDVATLKERRTLNPRRNASVFSLEFSPDGTLLAQATDYGTVLLWDIATGAVRFSLMGHTAAILCVAFHPDGATLASASVDGTVKLWDASTGQERVTLTDHTDGVLAVAFAPNGNMLATVSMDGTVKLWRAATDQAARARRR